MKMEGWGGMRVFGTEGTAKTSAGGGGRAGGLGDPKRHIVLGGGRGAEGCKVGLQRSL